ncbi:MAG: TraR/DksA C4-type zinc finger protein [Deltaproteobacteria bacterium]|nr:TraR/DksA C4-type zinc finger protein [Deltaproteobacteria bacterium]
MRFRIDMADLDQAQLALLRADLQALAGKLRALIESVREAAKPVDLDEPIGRLSRMDAIQEQNMLQANRRAAQQRLAHAEAALRRFEQAEYGECMECGEDVGFARLKARPETPFCIACQSSREAPR